MMMMTMSTAIGLQRAQSTHAQHPPWWPIVAASRTGQAHRRVLPDGLLMVAALTVPSTWARTCLSLMARNPRLPAQRSHRALSHQAAASASCRTEFNMPLLVSSPAVIAITRLDVHQHPHV